MKQIEYSLIQENNKQNIYLQNDFDCSGDISGDLKKLMDLERILSSDEYLDHVKGEGGTGIPKICKIIRKDLRKNGIIKFGLKEQENKFLLKLRFRSAYESIDCRKTIRINVII